MEFIGYVRNYVASRGPLRGVNNRFIAEYL